MIGSKSMFGLKCVSSTRHMALICSDWFRFRILCAFLIRSVDHSVVVIVNARLSDEKMIKVRYCTSSSSANSTCSQRTRSVIGIAITIPSFISSRMNLSVKYAR